jgi:diguanylate cyclase (GGDEF)-like protein
MLLALLAALLAFFYRGYRSRKHALHLEQVVEERTLQLKQVNEGLDWLANHDNLTRLSNRHHVQNIIQDFAEQTHLEPMGVVILDLDHFKKINDQFGHALGDQALSDFSLMLTEQVSSHHTPARWGGEEFVVLCPKTSLEDLLQLVQQVLQQCQQLNLTTDDQQTVAIRCSVGFIHCDDLPAAAEVPNFVEKAIQLADQALYEAKQQGRNQAHGYVICEAHQQRSINRYLTDTQQALAAGHLREVSFTASDELPADNSQTESTQQP